MHINLMVMIVQVSYVLPESLCYAHFFIQEHNIVTNVGEHPEDVHLPTSK